MTAKEYLEQAKRMLLRIEALQERRQHYEDLASSATAHYRSGPGGTKRVSSVEEYALKLVDLSSEMQLRADIYAETLREIERVIEAVPIPLYRDVLKYRYLNGWKWEQIGRAMNYSRQGVTHIHKRALLCVMVPKGAEPVEETVKRALRNRAEPRA